jgi:hypothetical protein
MQRQTQAMRASTKAFKLKVKNIYSESLIDLQGAAFRD